MAYDYYTVWALANELKEALVGKDIYAANTRGEVLYMQLGDGSLLAECRRDGTLRLLTADRKRGPVTQGHGAERYLAGARVIDVGVAGRDRVIFLRLARENRRGERSYGSLFFELLSNRVACALTSERTGEILGAWGREDRIKIGQVYAPPTGLDRFLPGIDEEGLFIEKVVEGELINLGDICRRLLVGLDRQQMAELFYRSGLTPETDWDQENLHALWVAAEAMFHEAEEPNGYAYQLKQRWHFSALKPARLLEGSLVEVADSVSAVASYTTRENGKAERTRRHRDMLHQLLRKELKSCRKKLAAMRADLKEAEKGSDWERKGHILLAQVDSVTPASQEVELKDIFDPDGKRRCRIVLNPQLSAVENAGHFLKKAQKFQRRETLLPERIKREEIVEKELAECEARLSDPDRDAREIEEWLENRGIRGKKSGDVSPRNGKRKEGQGAYPRQYTTSDGWTVLAGRNNKENDILTHKMAAQNDMWFHAHGYPGSHVILRREGRKEEPSKQSLGEAAGVAAFWSKGKSAKKVPVVYTLVKYVSKPKGGAPGQAIMKREKTIIVEPKVLAESKDSYKLNYVK